MSKHVLVVDDEAGILELAKTILESQGHMVTLATSLTGGLKILEEMTPDAIVCDHKMSDGSGLVLLMHALTQVRFDKTVLVLSSGSTEMTYSRPVSLHELCKVLGLRRISKPFQVLELLISVT